MTDDLPAPAKLARLTRLSLNNAHLPVFPRGLLAASKLRELDAFRALAWDGDPTIPAGIAKLANLEQLTLGGNSFRELPAAIGKLSRLEVLGLHYCSELRALPPSIGKLTELRELNLGATEKLKELPKSLGRLAKLETLVLHDCGVKGIPPELWKCSKLKVLSLPSKLKKLPPGIAKLQNLETLGISPAALQSIADELPKLSKLRELHMNVSGKARGLPESVGLIANLKELEVSFLELESLPESLFGHAKLERLDVAGNKLATLIELVRSLPKLRELDWSDNPLPLKEKREIQALLKLPPGKRAKAKPKIAAPPKLKPKSLGTVASINAYLALLFVDAKIGKAWTGIGEGGEPAGDWARASKALETRELASLEIGTGRGTVVVLGVWQGVAQVFRVGERVTFAEVFCDDDDDPLFREWIAAEPSKQAKKVADIEIASGKLAMLPTTNTLADGEELIVSLSKGSWSLLLEPEVDDAWGSGRRGHLIPATV
jgi:hypothetical protein